MSGPAVVVRFDDGEDALATLYVMIRGGLAERSGRANATGEQIVTLTPQGVLWFREVAARAGAEVPIEDALVYCARLIKLGLRPDWWDDGPPAIIVDDTP